MFVGALVVDLLLGDVHSLKHKRAVVRPLLAQLKKLDVSAAETGHQDLHRRAELSVGVVAGDVAHVQRVLDAAERVVADDPEVQLLSAHTMIHSDDD
ncbi:DUF503 domain-containing protein [Quadrisphaera sp. INWT6]|uniref:DUF503 domain-containing protein n=1 Tax=Quadrisphaera sp. INWT6 TaxID=2596917 RepID=UPI0018926E99|nr:DUF503 domain-containing protein [Quadrisphaera sp. INWT6]MBF5080723.1 DUF503 domain-containing protein [Quadrisphaera sp. INWT6]